jgi:hypothetical protein
MPDLELAPVVMDVGLYQVDSGVEGKTYVRHLVSEAMCDRKHRRISHDAPL